MPNLIPNFLDQINIAGNTYVLGATLAGTATTGTASINITGLSGGITYWFAVVSFNGAGYSGFAGPIAIFTIPETRPEIYAFAWNWPNLSIASTELGRGYVSGNSGNLFVDSTALVSIPIIAFFGSPLAYLPGTTFIGGISDPFGGTGAFAIVTPGVADNYYSVRHNTCALNPGTTYTFSFWHHVTPSVLGGGVTISGTRLSDFSPDYQDSGGNPPFRDLPWQQIAPVVGSLATEPGALYGTGTGWQRFAFRFYVGLTLDKASPHIISRNNPPVSAGGYTHYFYGFQLEEGNTTTSYKATTRNDALPGVFYRRFYYSDLGVGGGKNLKYTISSNDALSFAPQNGLTYLSFLEFTPDASFRPGAFDINSSFASGLTKSYNTYEGIERLKQLPSGKKVLQPIALGNSDFWVTFFEDRLSGATGANVRFTDNDALKNYPQQSSTVAENYYNPWASVGLTIGKNLFTSTLETIKNRGVTAIDGIFLDIEGDPFAADPGPIAPLQLGPQLIPNQPQYSQTGINGISSWKNIFESAGGSLARGVTPYVYPSTHPPDWLAWGRASKFYQAENINEVYYEPLQSIFGNSAYISNYDFYDKEVGLTATAPDGYGHPTQGKRSGNASSPVCYGWVAQLGGYYEITTSGAITPYTIWVVDPNDSTTLIPGSFFPGGISLQRGPWASFGQGMQQIREAKRISPSIPLTPWIGSVDWADENYTSLVGVCWDSGAGQSPLVVRNQLISLGLSGNTATFWSPLPPFIGWSNVRGNTYNPRQGIYYTGQGGNSAYYYEFIRHIMLHGTRSIGYFNPHDFIDVSVPGNTLPGQTYGIYNGSQGYLNYMVSGKTQHIQNMQLLNNVIHEVHQRIGGFTLTTADSRRISWLAPYVASGAPGLNGITWHWRITTNPGFTTYVNGQTLSVANNNIVGTWITTSGPTLAGVNITSTT